MKTLNDTQIKLLASNATANTACFVTAKNGIETIYAAMLNGKVYKAEQPVSDKVAQYGYTPCNGIPAEATFIGYYRVVSLNGVAA